MQASGEISVTIEQGLNLNFTGVNYISTTFLSESLNTREL